jgi:glutathione S-transferase
MAILHHYPFCPNSRFVRIVLAEIGLEPELKEERPWERRIEYLGLNPAGSTPTLVDGEVVAPGAAVIAEYLDETRGGSSIGSSASSRRRSPAISSPRRSSSASWGRGAGRRT